MATRDQEMLAEISGEVWPVDIDALSKGDSIGSEILAEFFGVEYGSQVYQLRLAGFVQKLEVALWAKGKQYVLRCSQGSVSILTDTEAAEYTQARFGAHYRGLRRSHRRAAVVDRSRLADDARNRHDRALVVQGGMLAAASRAVVELKAVPYERNTPPVIYDPGE